MSTCKRASIILLDIPAHRSHKLKYSADLSAPNANSLITAFAHHANGDEASKAHYQMADRESFQMMCVALHNNEQCASAQPCSPASLRALFFLRASDARQQTQVQKCASGEYVTQDVTRSEIASSNGN